MMVTTVAGQKAKHGPAVVTLLVAMIVASVVMLGLLAGTAAHADTTFTVNTTGDENDLDFPDGASDGSPDGNCDVDGAASGDQCTLRAAIQEANVTTGADTINFDIPADTDAGCDATTGVCTIAPEGSDLPDITEPVIIDGYTQDDASLNTLSTGNNAQLKVELSGADAGDGANGLRIRASNSVVRGLVINGWSNEGVEINGVGGPGVSGNRVEGNFIGTDVTGEESEEALANVNGVRLVDNASDNVVGGTSAAARNVISGNTRGIEIAIGSNGNKIQGNYVGTDTSGTEDLGNLLEGVEILSSTDNVVGGTSAAARNVISGNDRDGVVFGSFNNGGNEIRGNYIGTDVTGQEGLGNAEDGVDIQGDSLDNVVGGTSAGARNVISGNDDDGVELDNGTNDRVQGNYIGTDASGQGDLGNGDEGVYVIDAMNTAVGGTSAAASNTIAFNAGDGVDVDDLSGDPGTGNSILRNTIFSNGELGIDLDSDNENSFDVTPNDPQDPDTGPNLLQNFPVLTFAATPDGQSVAVRGTFNSTLTDAFIIRFFSSPQADPSGFGEGETYLGQTNVTTNARGNAAFSFSSPNASVAAGEVVTATATNSETGDTSEFSRAIEVDRGCTIEGTRGDDELTGTPQDDVICGRLGEDTIRGLAGDDILLGNKGIDTIRGEGDGDTLLGGNARDRLIGGGGADELRGQFNNDALDARDGVRGNDVARGGPQTDTCVADAGDEQVGCEN